MSCRSTVKDQIASLPYFLPYFALEKNWEHKPKCKNFVQVSTFEWFVKKPKREGFCLWIPWDPKAKPLFIQELITSLQNFYYFDYYVLFYFLSPLLEKQQGYYVIVNAFVGVYVWLCMFQFGQVFINSIWVFFEKLEVQ